MHGINACCQLGAALFRRSKKTCLCIRRSHGVAAANSEGELAALEDGAADEGGAALGGGAAAATFEGDLEGGAAVEGGAALGYSAAAAISEGELAQGATARWMKEGDNAAKAAWWIKQGPEAMLLAVAEAMWESGEIVRTSHEQRLRNTMKAGSEYVTPPRYTDLVRNGYLSPNLPPPQGYIWHASGGKWVLASRGG